MSNRAGEWSCVWARNTLIWALWSIWIMPPCHASHSAFNKLSNFNHNENRFTQRTLRTFMHKIILIGDDFWRSCPPTPFQSRVNFKVMLYSPETCLVKFSIFPMICFQGWRFHSLSLGTSSNIQPPIQYFFPLPSVWDFSCCSLCLLPLITLHLWEYLWDSFLPVSSY